MITFSGVEQVFEIEIPKNLELEILFQSSPYESAKISYHYESKTKIARIHLGAFSGIVFKFRSQKTQLKLKK